MVLGDFCVMIEICNTNLVITLKPTFFFCFSDLHFCAFFAFTSLHGFEQISCLTLSDNKSFPLNH